MEKIASPSSLSLDERLYVHCALSNDGDGPYDGDKDVYWDSEWW